MYYRNMNLRVYRNATIPDAGGSAGGALPASATPQADTASATPASDSPRYLTEDAFNERFGRLEQHIQRLTPAQQAKQDAKDVKETGSKRPSPKDYDFDKDPEALQKYEDALDDWRYARRQEAAAKERTESEARERTERTAKGHAARVLEYKKENPSYEADMKKAAGSMMGEPEVTEAVQGHKDSPAILHYLAKNLNTLDELNQIALSSDRDAVLTRVAEIAYEIRAEKKALEANKEAAKDVPPRQNFRGNTPSKDREPSLEERFARATK